MLLPLLLFAAAQAQEPTRAAAAADRFALDLPVDDAVTAPPQPEPAATPAAPAATHFSLDTPIVDLIADPRAKAVLDRDVPGLSDDENLPKFQALSLRKLAPLSGGQMTGKLLTRLAYDLAAIPSGDPPKRAESRRALPSGR